MLVCSLGYGKLLVSMIRKYIDYVYFILGGYYGKPNECWYDNQQT